MQLREFSLISPVLEAGEVLKALEIAIPAEAIEQAIVDTHSLAERQRKLPAPEGGVFSHCYEHLVEGLDEKCAQELSGWSEYRMDSPVSILASAE